MRPFFPYYGAKWNLARRYGVPQHDLVIEPFAGSAAYSVFHDAPLVLLIDSDPIITGVWRYLIGASEREILALPELADAGDSVNDYAIPQEARWLIGFWINRGSATPKTTRTAYSARADRGQLNWGARAKDRIASQLDGIRDWEVLEGDFTKAPDWSATWFIDPPYVDKGRYYRHHDIDYGVLASWSLSRRGEVIVCEGEGADWLPFEPLGMVKTSRGASHEKVYRFTKTRPETSA